MPETPDFDANAAMVNDLDLAMLTHPANYAVLKTYLVALQRDIWNARGAADLTMVHEQRPIFRIGAHMLAEDGTQWSAKDEYANDLKHAIRSSDR
jgi:hypothetical protein